MLGSWKLGICHLLSGTLIDCATYVIPLKEKMKKLIFLFVSLLTFTVSAQNADSDYSLVVADVDIMKLEGVE